MSDERQAPDPEIAQIAAALERLGMRRPPRPHSHGGPPFGPGGPGGFPFGPGGRGGPWGRGRPDRASDDHEHPHAQGGHDHEHGDPRHGFGAGGRGERGFGGPGRGGPRAAMGARRLLQALAEASEPRSITELGQAIGVDQPRASRLVQGLADAGLVRRIADPADGRRTVVELTSAGRRHVQAHVEARASEVAVAAQALTAEERATLAALLTRLADAWPAP